MEIIVDFKVEFLGIVYTILIIDFSIFMRSELKSVRFKTMFLTGVNNCVELISIHLTSNFKIELNGDIKYDYELIFDNIYSKKLDVLFDRLNQISEYLIGLENQVKHLMEVYDPIINIELRTCFLDTIFLANNNNYFRNFQIDILYKERNSEKILDKSFELAGFFDLAMSDEDRLEVIFEKILRSNILLFFNILNNFYAIEKSIIKYYEPLFKIEYLKSVKLHLTP